MTSGPRPGAETTRHHYVYDAWNRLVEVKADSDGSPGDTIAEYRYDALGRRITRIVKDGENWDRTDFYYTTSWQVIEERLADDVTTANKGNLATNVYRQYVWDVRYVDAPVLRDEDTDSDGDCTDDGGSERLTYCQDANFNTTALVNASGTVVERYVYDPYGQVTIWNEARTSTLAWADSKKNEILFCGYRYDPETALYHVRHRMYHSTLGRWLQRDPLGYVDGMGLYEYCMSAPMVAVDPLGRGIGEVFEHPGAAWEGFKEGADDGCHYLVNAMTLTMPERLGAAPPPDLTEKYGTAGTVAKVASWTATATFWALVAEAADVLIGPNLEKEKPPSEDAPPEADDRTRDGEPIHQHDGELPVERGPDGKPLRGSDRKVIPKRDQAGPHFQVAPNKPPKKGEPYPQVREWGEGTSPERDIDITDHNQPEFHTDPHQHRYDGGKRGPPEPLH